MVYNSFFERNAIVVARAMIGAQLLLDGVGGLVVETEAYVPSDPASHSFRGMTPRNRAMFGPAGCAYVYRSHGLHWCLNAVCLPGSAVLIRALQPTLGIDAMRENRGPFPDKLLCAGPGRLCQALGVNRSHDGAPFDGGAFAFSPPTIPQEVVVGIRIGISKGVDEPWRFGLAGSQFVSRRF